MSPEIEAQLRRDSVDFNRLAAQVIAGERFGLLQGGPSAEVLASRAAAIEVIRRQLPAGWRILADDVSEEKQLLLRGEWHGKPAVFKLAHHVIDVDHWRRMVDELSCAARESDRGCSLLIPVDVCSVVCGVGEAVFPLLAYPQLGGNDLHRSPRFGHATELDLRTLLGAIGRAVTLLQRVTPNGHGDVKVQNVFIDHDRGPVLLDWHFWEPVRQQYVPVGEAAFRFAPPVEKVQPGTLADDLYCAGFSAFLAATGVSPHNPFLAWQQHPVAIRQWYGFAQRALELVGDGRSADARLSTRRPDLSADLVDLIEGCLWADPARRPSLDQLFKADTEVSLST